MALKNVYFDNWTEFIEFVDRMNQIVIKKQQAMNKPKNTINWDYTPEQEIQDEEKYYEKKLAKQVA